MTGTFAKPADERERRILGALGPAGHPGLVPLLDGAAGSVVLARAHGDAASRSSWPDALVVDEVVAAFEPVAAALAALHEAGHLHRDVHPANVLVADGPTEPLRLWLCDPGAPGEGHPGFVGPEVLAGRPFSPAADTFGLAATIDAVLDLLGLALDPAGQAALDRGLHPRPALRPDPVALVAALRGSHARSTVPSGLDLHAPTLPFELWPDLEQAPPAVAIDAPPSRRRAVTAAALAAALLVAGAVAACITQGARATRGVVLAPAPLRACPPALAPRVSDADRVAADVDGDGCDEVVVRTATGATAFGPGGALVAEAALGSGWLVGDWACHGRPGPAVRDAASGRVQTWSSWRDAFAGRRAVEVRGPAGPGAAVVVPPRAGRCAVVRLVPRATWPKAPATGGASESTLRGNAAPPQAMLDYDTT